MVGCKGFVWMSYVHVVFLLRIFIPIFDRYFFSLFAKSHKMIVLPIRGISYMRADILTSSLYYLISIKQKVQRN